MSRATSVALVYVFACLITALAIILRVALTPWMGMSLPLLTLFPATAVVAMFWGLRPALIPAIAGFLLCNHLFEIHTGDFAVESLAGMIVLTAYAASVTPILWCGEALLRARRELSEQKDRLRLSLAGIGDAVISTDAAGRVTSLNAPALAITGWEESAALGESVEKVLPLFHESSREPAPNPSLQAIREKARTELSTHLLIAGPDSREIVLEAAAAPLSDKGVVAGAILVFRDISERRASEQALREDRKRFQLLAELATQTQRLSEPDEIMEVTARLLARYLGVDRCAYAEVEEESVFVITGDYTRGVSSIVGRWPVAAFGPEVEAQMMANLPFVANDVDAHPQLAPYLDAYRKTEIRAVICVPLHKSGTFTAAMAVHQRHPRRWTQHEIDLVTSVVGRCWESLERSRANRALQDTADRLQLALNASRLGDWSWDAETDVVMLSPRAAEIWGLAPEPITWSEMYERLHDDDRGPTIAKVEKAMETCGRYDTEYRVMMPDGSQVWIAAMGQAYLGLEGNPEGIFGVVMDITERKRLEEELRLRTESLSSADRKKDDFIALLAHELRNPLAPIRTGLELLGHIGDDNERAVAARGMMERQLDHLVRLVDDLLDVSRITRNKLTLHFEPILLSDALTHAVESARSQQPHLDHRIHWDLPEGEVFVRGDATRISQIFGNLISNSIKFTPTGGNIGISVTKEPGHARIAIQDDGMGIEESKLEQIFEMFEQAHRSGNGGGLGIGLGLVKALVEMHGGEVYAESAGPGKGSTFCVKLPTIDGQGAAPSSVASREARSPLYGCRVLVVDDNLSASSSLTLLIQSRGATSFSAADGRSAIEAAERKRPDLILMDVGLPDIGGYEVTRRIRSHEWGKDITIVALTGWGREEDRAQSREAGCDGHLVKPVKLAEIEAMWLHQSAIKPSAITADSDP